MLSYVGYGIGTLAATLGVHQYVRIQEKQLEGLVYEKIKTGNKPHIPH